MQSDTTTRHDCVTPFTVGLGGCRSVITRYLNLGLRFHCSIIGLIILFRCTMMTKHDNICKTVLSHSVESPASIYMDTFGFFMSKMYSTLMHPLNMICCMLWAKKKRNMYISLVLTMNIHVQEHKDDHYERPAHCKHHLLRVGIKANSCIFGRSQITNTKKGVLRQQLRTCCKV